MALSGPKRASYSRSRRRPATPLDRAINAPTTNAAAWAVKKRCRRPEGVFNADEPECACETADWLAEVRGKQSHTFGRQVF
jgi:hypothetical protein